jgi:hypothetical protein
MLRAVVNLYQDSMKIYGKSPGLNRVMPATRSKSESLVARNEIPYSRMQDTIIESLVSSPAACLSDCADLMMLSLTGMKSKFRFSN